VPSSASPHLKCTDMLLNCLSTTHGNPTVSPVRLTRIPPHRVRCSPTDRFQTSRPHYVRCSIPDHRCVPYHIEDFHTNPQPHHVRCSIGGESTPPCQLLNGSVPTQPNPLCPLIFKHSCDINPGSADTVGCSRSPVRYTMGK
jgi:hypothetical protein